MIIHEIRMEGFPPFKMGFDSNFYADWALLSFLSRDCMPEPEVVDVIRRVVRPGDVVIDGGANVGFYSMLMAEIVGEIGRVIAFEPAPVNIEKFQQNRDLNRFTNVALYTDALWAVAEQVDLWVGKDSGQSALWSSVDSLHRIQVRALPLDAIAPALLAAGVRFMKLDLEGAEEQALLGATQLMEKGWPTFVVCELNPVALAQLGSNQDGLRAHMQNCGYQTFLLREDGGWPALVPDGMRIRPKKQNCNILFARMYDVQMTWQEAVP